MSARVMPAQGGNGVDVKDWSALEEAVRKVADGRRQYLEVYDEDIDWLAVEFTGTDGTELSRLAIQGSGAIDATDLLHRRISAPITPEMYPVVKAAIAEIERQNA